MILVKLDVFGAVPHVVIIIVFDHYCPVGRQERAGRMTGGHPVTSPNPGQVEQKSYLLQRELASRVKGPPAENWLTRFHYPPWNEYERIDGTGIAFSGQTARLLLRNCPTCVL